VNLPGDVLERFKILARFVHNCQIPDLQNADRVKIRPYFNTIFGIQVSGVQLGLGRFVLIHDLQRRAVSDTICRKYIANYLLLGLLARHIYEDES